MNRAALLIALAAFLAGAAPALAAPVGIGFVQAEEGTWFCRDADAAKAFDCARRKCAAEGGGQECHPTRWCYPAGWSGTMIVWLSEFHTTVPICGGPSGEAVREALKALCAGFDDGHRCDLTAIIDPEGKAEAVEGVVWPGPVMAPPEDADPEAEPPETP